MHVVRHPSPVQDKPNDYGKVMQPSPLVTPSPACMVCGHATVSLSVDTTVFTLANFVRAQLYGVFGTLSLGMRVLDARARARVGDPLGRPLRCRSRGFTGGATAGPSTPG